ncbi:hypothetical protein Poli38472_013554 [Pythium oligandrum]|uniref:Uncharacterized protein n=1 Tax=Pythium oligandrum TaxID=41045 RepID=A0A8K1FC95_PYTOL|nr:hypothetical protein Poli38472_013554 [Pythium oligandrum]|eukprot:TMW58080.1 hypothetical protein Poli38472_013554 [Pythium oligandrum]
MAQRRRLALRQIAEPELIDVLSDSDENGDVDMEAAAPSFALLPTVSEAPSVTAPGAGEVETTQELSPPTPLDGTKPNKRRKSAIAMTKANGTQVTNGDVNDAGGKADIVALYQEGVLSQHTLRLHYIRRKPSSLCHRHTMPIEHDFVLPPPTLSLLEVISPPEISLESTDSATNAVDTLSKIDMKPVDDRELHQVLQSVREHWYLPRSTSNETRESWRRLQECDWGTAIQSPTATDELPTTSDVVWLLQDLQSDAFAMFVWQNLLLPIIKRESHATTSVVYELCDALLQHKCFRSLLPKDFRAQLRAKNLRAIDSPLAIELELHLIRRFLELR